MIIFEEKNISWDDTFKPLHFVNKLIPLHFTTTLYYFYNIIMKYIEILRFKSVVFIENKKVVIEMGGRTNPDNNWPNIEIYNTISIIWLGIDPWEQ